MYITNSTIMTYHCCYVYDKFNVTKLKNEIVSISYDNISFINPYFFVIYMRFN